MRSASSRGWIVVAAGTGINLALGVLYSWSVVAKELTSSDGWGWTASQASLPYAVACGVFAVMMVFAGRAQDRFGPRIVASLGGALTGAGMMLAGFASQGSSFLMVLGFGVLAGSGIGLGYASATPPAVKWFPPARKGLVTGVVVSGFGLASVYIAPVTRGLLDALDIRSTFFILGGAFLLVTVGLAQLLKNPPSGYVPAVVDSDKSASSSRPTRDVEWRDMIRTPQFARLWLSYACASFAGLMIIGHLAKIAGAQLAGVELGFILVAVLAIGNAAGRICAGVASDKLGRNRTMVAVFVFQAAMMGVIGRVSAPVIMVVVAMCIGFNYGANLSLFPAATADFFGTKNLGVNYGFVFTAWGVGGVFGSMVAGTIVDATGSYSAAFGVAGALLLVAALLAFALREPEAAPEVAVAPSSRETLGVSEESA